MKYTKYLDKSISDKQSNISFINHVLVTAMVTMRPQIKKIHFFLSRMLNELKVYHTLTQITTI